jgi:hypothetical protein
VHKHLNNIDIGHHLDLATGFTGPGQFRLDADERRWSSSLW